MNRSITAGTRRLVLGTALAVSLLAWLAPHPSDVRAAPPTLVTVQADASKGAPAAGGPAERPGAAASDRAAAPGGAKAADQDTAGDDADAEEAKGAHHGTDITIDRHGIRVEKGKKRVTVQAFGADREYDSFESFVQDAPWLAGLVFLVVLLVFLVPLLIIVLLIWYKVRKNRMLNETMLKLAERGVVPPAEAMAALDANRVASGPTTTPLYEQARQFRQRAIASDLRKGVVLIAVGLAFSFYSMIADGEPNWIGLICLFLGIGYCVLWVMEDRTTVPPANGTPPPGGA